MSITTYSKPNPPAPPSPYQPPLVLKWNRLACDALYYAKMGPTLSARALAMVHTAIYDAWTAYSGGKEVSTTTYARWKRPASECTKTNREIAYSFAAYRVLEALFAERLPAEHKNMFADCMQELGYDIENHSEDVSTPEGIGNLSGRLLLEYREGDESNQERGYVDYTGYKPVNPPPPQKPLVDVMRWQPQYYNKTVQKFLTPQWGLLKPFALEWGGQFRPPTPAGAGSQKFQKEVEDVIKISRNLTDEQKIIAEYWAGMHEDKFDGSPTGYKDYWTTPPAQACRIGHFIATKNQLKNSGAVMFFFALTNALLDASIAAWDCKVYYDYTRPDSAIHELYDETPLDAWGGPCRGTVAMEGEGWCPYLVTTPPFAEYVSGHSTFSRAMAEIINCFCGSSEYGEEVIIPKDSSKIEPHCTPKQDIKLAWKTVYDAARQAGMSRLYGGIHFEEGNLQGQELGRKVALCVWEKVCNYWDGKYA